MSHIEATVPDPNCKRCKGDGWFWVQNGPDDIDKEPCDCEQSILPSVNDLINILSIKYFI